MPKARSVEFPTTSTKSGKTSNHIITKIRAWLLRSTEIKVGSICTTSALSKMCPMQTTKVVVRDAHIPHVTKITMAHLINSKITAIETIVVAQEEEDVAVAMTSTARLDNTPTTILASRTNSTKTWEPSHRDQCLLHLFPKLCLSLCHQCPWCP